MNEVKVPRINANEDEVFLSDILVREGDRVTEGQELFSVETTKSTISVNAEQDGYVRRILVTQTEMVDVGKLLCILTESPDEPLDADLAQESAAAESVQDAPEMTAKQRLLAKKKAAKSRTAADAVEEETWVPSEELPWVAEARETLSKQDVSGACSVFSEEDARQQGFVVGEQVRWGSGVSIKARRLWIGEGAVIGSDTIIDADAVYIGAYTKIGKRSEMITREIIIGDGVVVGQEVLVDIAGGLSSESRLLVGNGCLIASRAMVNTCREVIMEPESALSPGAMVFTHRFWQSVLDGYSTRFSSVRIGHRAWVGAGCQILPGTKIGIGSIVISNSTVTDNVPAGCLFGGIPGKVLRENAACEIAPAERVNILADQLDGFSQLLSFKGCETELAADRKSLTVGLPDGDTHTIELLETEKTDATFRDKRIVLLLEGTVEEPVQGSVFLFESMTFIGETTPLSAELRNYLRRQGIRFHPFAWDSSYKKGLPDA